MDDEQVASPCWELAEKTGLRNICIHKGLIPPDYENFTNWKYAAADDIPAAAKAFPNLNFIIYQAVLRPAMDLDSTEAEFGKTGYKDKLARIRADYQAQGTQPSHAYYGWIQRSA